jgi:endonuclease/exonuclease/phosphatase family metal-dependent hydrolase
VVHLNTHLDHISERARVEGARLIVERLAAAEADGSAAIVTGDFNAPVASPTYELFRAAGFGDAHVLCANDDAAAPAFTYHGFQGEAFRGSDAPPRRIDWIMLRDGDATKLRAERCEIVRDAQPPVYPSDHFPVVAEVTVW